MSEVSKNELKYDNSVSFPNNNTGAITPADLRNFNVDLIDSTVNQTLYTADSASLNSRINDTNTDLSGLIETASVNVDVITFTKFNGSSFNLTVTSSLPTIAWDSVTGKPAGLVSGSSQVVSILNPLNAFSASQETKNSTLATYTGSVTTQLTNLSTSQSIDNTKWSNLGSQSGSFVTESETGSFARTNITNTFTATQNITGDLNITGTLTATEIHTIIESSSVIFSSGSNILGDDPNNDNQTLNGTTTINGNTRINGTTHQITGSTSTTDSITINKSGGNGLVLSNSGISSAGSIVGSNGITALGSTSTFTAKLNAVNSGSQFPTFDAIISNNNNEFGGFGIYRQGSYPDTTFTGLVASAYSPQYSGTTLPMIIANGNNPGGNDTAIIWKSDGTAEHWKKSDFKYGIDVTGSVRLTPASTSTNAAYPIPFISGSTISKDSVDTLTYNPSTNILRLTGSVIGNKVGAFDFDTIFLGSQLGGSTANGTFFGYGSTDYQFIVGAYAGGFDSELKITADNTGITFGDFNGSTYPSWLKLNPNTGTNPAPVFTRGLQVTGSLNANTLVVSGSTITTGSVRGNVNTQTITSNTASFDFSTSNFFQLTLVSGSTTRVEATNVRPGQTVNVLITQPASGTGSITFSNNFDFPQFSAYTASAVSSAKDVLTFITFADTSSIYSVAVKNMI